MDMINLLATLIEYAAMLKVSHIFVKRKFSRSNWLLTGGCIILGCCVIQLCQLEMHLWAWMILNLLWVRIHLSKEPWYVIISISLISYGADILLQFIYLLWIPLALFEWIGYYYVGLILNSIVLLTTIAIAKMLEWGDLRCEYQELSRGVWIGLDCAAVGLIGFCQIVKGSIMEVYRTELEWVTLVIFISLFVILTVALIQTKARKAREEKQNESIKNYFYEQQHDYKKQLLVLQENRTWMSDYTQEYEEQEGLLRLEPSVLSVLIPYLRRMEDERIPHSIYVTPIVPSYNIPQKAMVTVLGNILENAMRETLAAAEAGIRIEFHTLEDDNRIRVINSCGNTPKSPEEGHGYGLKKIRKVLRNYKGCLVTAQRDGRYIAEVIIPKGKN